MVDDELLIWVLPLRTFDSTSQRMARLHIAQLQKHPQLVSLQVKDKEDGLTELSVAFKPELSHRDQRKILDKIFRSPIVHQPRGPTTRWVRLLQKADSVLKDDEPGV